MYQDMETINNQQEQGSLKIRNCDGILNEIETILDNPDAIKSFINMRILELKQDSKPVEIGSMSKDWYSGFIHPDSKIRRSYMVDPFHIDDDFVYEKLFTTIKEFKSNPGWKDRQLKEMLPFLINHTVINYFGNLISSSDTEDRNRGFYHEHDDPAMDDISLSELKGKNIAVCAEKSALSQNLASFLGLESYLVMSNTCKLEPDGKEDLHAYNIWKTKKAYFIFDPTNPQLALSKDTRDIITYVPATYPISEDDFNKIKSGGTVSVEHKNRITNTNNTAPEYEISKRIYGGPKK